MINNLCDSCGRQTCNCFFTGGAYCDDYLGPNYTPKWWIDKCKELSNKDFYDYQSLRAQKLNQR